MRQYIQVLQEGFGLTDNVAAAYYKLCKGALQQHTQIHYLANLEGKPVGCATLSIGKNSSEIWNLATKESSRNHGVGSALIEKALKTAEEKDKAQTMAILMPKGLAAGIFAKAGFEAVCDFPFYLYGSDPASLEK